MKLPAPDHPITITSHGKHVRVAFAGRVVVDTTRALRLQEAGYKPVLYIPGVEADTSRLTRTSHSPHVPYKADASYFSIVAEGRTAENAVWCYESPVPAMAEIKEHLAFFPNRVEA